MKNQALFSLNNKSEKLKCLLLQFLFGTLRVNIRNFDQYLSFDLLSLWFRNPAGG